MANSSGAGLFDLGGKVALITGASAGLGLAVTQALASAGAAVVSVARRELKLRQACETLTQQYAVQNAYVVADLAQRANQTSALTAA